MKKGQLDQTLISQKKMLAKPEQFSSPDDLKASEAALSVLSAGGTAGSSGC